MAKEQFYTIKVIAHSLRNNIIAKYGDVVSEKQLSGSPLELIEQKFIEAVVPEDKPKVKEPENKELGEAKKTEKALKK